MAQIEIAPLCTAISDRFRGVAPLRRIEDATEITETIPPGDMPLLIVYPESHEAATNSGTQMNTFGGGANRPVIQEEPLIHVDVYLGLIGQANLAEVLGKMMECWDAMANVFRSETVQPYFGYEHIKSFQWSISRVELRFAGNRYWGMSGELTIRSF